MADLISPSELAALAASDSSVLILDVRWRLDRQDGRPEYLEGHIPGAVFVDLGRDLARHGLPGDGQPVYPGSWSQLSNTPGRPVATGASPGGELR